MTMCLGCLSIEQERAPSLRWLYSSYPGLVRLLPFPCVGVPNLESLQVPSPFCGSQQHLIHLIYMQIRSLFVYHKTSLPAQVAGKHKLSWRLHIWIGYGVRVLLYIAHLGFLYGSIRLIWHCSSHQRSSMWSRSLSYHSNRTAQAGTCGRWVSRKQISLEHIHRPLVRPASTNRRTLWLYLPCNKHPPYRTRTSTRPCQVLHTIRPSFE